MGGSSMPPWDWWVPLAWAVLLLTSVRGATISFDNGLGQRAMGWSEVSFSVTEAGTTALSDLSFETDLSSISSASSSSTNGATETTTEGAVNIYTFKENKLKINLLRFLYF